MTAVEDLINKFCHYTECTGGTARETLDEVMTKGRFPKTYHCTITDTDRQFLLHILREYQARSA